MGFSTDFIGHIDIEPPLNEAEIEYLSAFGESRRFRREGGPYDVPGNPIAERDDVGSHGEEYNVPGVGQPNLWCDWRVCWDGCCLAWNGIEKSYSMVRWLGYLIDHFLAPGASASGRPGFEDFTFDHRLSGMVVGCRRDNKMLFSVRVENNVVKEDVLRPADPRYVDWPRLPYEDEIDRERARSSRRRRRTLRSV